MKKFECIIILWVMVFLLVGCSRNGNEEENDGKEILVNLDIRVALSDVSQPTRSEDADAESDDEKIQTLRIVVVRPDGIVEGNRFVPLVVAAEFYGYERFRVVGNEEKRIYLFVNERARVQFEDGRTDLNLTDYLSGIVPGQVFPKDEIASLMIRLDGVSEQLVGPLPMSECHKVTVPETDDNCNLFVTRAAVKFSFRITNKSSKSVNLTGLMMNKMARREYYLPHGVKYGEEVIDGKPYKVITDYEVPSFGNNDYYIYEAVINVPKALPVNQQVMLDPIYLLEGKYTDSVSDGKNYSMSIEIDGVQLGNYFPKLSQLPRNTHVVVNITIEDTECIWEVDVLPYCAKELEPLFGL